MPSAGSTAASYKERRTSWRFCNTMLPRLMPLLHCRRLPFVYGVPRGGGHGETVRSADQRDEFGDSNLLVVHSGRGPLASARARPPFAVVMMMRAERPRTWWSRVRELVSARRHVPERPNNQMRALALAGEHRPVTLGERQAPPSNQSVARPVGAPGTLDARGRSGTLNASAKGLTDIPSLFAEVLIIL